MNYVVLKKWLQEEKEMSERSAMDVVSRCRGVNRIVGNDAIIESTIGILVKTKSFDNIVRTFD